MKNTSFIYSEKRMNNQIDIEYNLTGHCRTRCQQRGITKLMILTAITYGVQIYRQGFTFYYVTARSLPPIVQNSLKKRISDLVVMVYEKEQKVITSYWSHKGLTSIKKKPKHLTYYSAA